MYVAFHLSLSHRGLLHPISGRRRMVWLGNLIGEKTNQKEANNSNYHHPFSCAFPCTCGETEIEKKGRYRKSSTRRPKCNSVIFFALTHASNAE